ncbi:MAG TPA: hypothetical protein VMG12_01730 [Polyangiaceae bacterium]|nr:hypothetical protein [Polyangiaceae bacterium]
MAKFLIVGLGLGLIVACKGDDVLDENVGGGSSGSGGSGGAACQYDDWRIAMAGAVFELPVAPAGGSWCPRDGIEVCTEGYASSTASDAGASEPGGVLSRCSGNVWQTVADATCQNTRNAADENCNVFNYREYDGQCCSLLRNCEEAFCDGERWWTRRE